MYDTFDFIEAIIRFRNSDSVPVIIIECFMVMSAILVLLGLIYVLVLIAAISIHHFWRDRDPKKVPPYVKRALQFDDDSDVEDVGIEVQIVSEESDVDSTVDRKTRKMVNLEKFLNKEMDAVH